MQRLYSNQSKHCDWCGSNFIVVKGRQSDMCPICFARLKSYQDAKQLVDKALKQADEAKKCLADITNQYKELASQGFKVPEELEGLK